MTRLNVGIDWKFGLRLVKLIKIDRKIQHFKLQKNLGYSNLEKFPFRFKLLTNIVVDPMEWKNLRDFEYWLQEQFGGGKYPDGFYYLWGRKSSLRWVKDQWGKHWGKVRPWCSFAKFLIRNGEIHFNLKENRGRKVKLMFKEEEARIERPRKLRFGKER